MTYLGFIPSTTCGPPNTAQTEKEILNAVSMKRVWSLVTVSALTFCVTRDLGARALLTAVSQQDGAVLVFLPGWDNISTLHDLLMSQVMFKSGNVEPYCHVQWYLSQWVASFSQAVYCWQTLWSVPVVWAWWAQTGSLGLGCWFSRMLYPLDKREVRANTELCRSPCDPDLCGTLDMQQMHPLSPFTLQALWTPS